MATQYASDADMQAIDLSGFIRQNIDASSLFVFTADKGPTMPVSVNKNMIQSLYGNAHPGNMISALKTAIPSGTHYALRVPASDARYSACLMGIFADKDDFKLEETYLGIAPLYNFNTWYGGSPENPADLSPIYRNGGLPVKTKKYSPLDAIAEGGSYFYNPSNSITKGQKGAKLVTALAVLYCNGTGTDGELIDVQIVSGNVSPLPSVRPSLIDGGNLQAGSYSYSRIPVTENGMQPDSASPAIHQDITAEDVANGKRAINLSWDLDDVSVRGVMVYRTFTSTDGKKITRLIGNLSRAQTTLLDDTFNYGTELSESDYSGLSTTRDTIVKNLILKVRYDGTVIENIPFSFNTQIEDGLAEPIDEAVNGSSSKLRCKRFYEVDQVQGVDIPVLYSTKYAGLRGGFNGVKEVQADDLQEALSPFLNRERFRVGAIPDLGFINSWATNLFGQVADAQRAHVLLSVPKEYQHAQSAVAYSASLTGMTRRFSIYTPWMNRRDPDTGSTALVLPSAFASQAMINSDASTSAGLGRSIAGLNRGVIDATSLSDNDEYSYSDEERDLLVLGKVNYFRAKRNVGYVLWEQWTLQNTLSKASFVNVSRLWDAIQNAIQDYLEYSLQEPNDEWMVNSIYSGLREYLAGLVRQRCLERFEVVLDGRAGNNDDTATEGIRNVDIYLSPTVATRRFQCRTILTRSGANFEDLMEAS